MENIYIVFIYLRTIRRFPIFELVSFGTVFGSHISYGEMGLRPIFSILCLLSQISFRSNVRFSKIFGHSSFRRDVLSVRCLSAICPFGHLSLGHMSVRPFVFWPTVLPPNTEVLWRREKVLAHTKKNI